MAEREHERICEADGFNPVEFGQLLANQAYADKRLDSLEAKVDLIVRAVERSKGGWVTLVTVGTIVAGAVETAHYIAGFIKGLGGH